MSVACAKLDSFHNIGNPQKSLQREVKLVQKLVEFGDYFVMNGLPNIKLSNTIIRFCAAFAKRLLFPTLAILIAIL